MKFEIEKFSLLLIFFFLTILSFFQTNTQSFGSVIDQDWTIIYNSLLIVSNFEQEYIDHPAYTTFLIYGVSLKIISLLFTDLNLDILNILDKQEPKNNFQNIFICLRIINSILIFLIFFLILKILKLFNVPSFYNVFILLVFLSFDSVYQLLFLLRSEAISVLLFLSSIFFLLKYMKKQFQKKYIIFGSIFFTLSILTKTQIFLLFLGVPFIFFFYKDRLIEQNKKNTINTFIEKILYIFIFFVIITLSIIYIKFPAPTDLTFIFFYIITYLIFHNIFKKINYLDVKQITYFIFFFIFGIFLTFISIIILDLLSIVRFDYSIIPNNFLRPVTHMSSFTTTFNITDNNFINIFNQIKDYFMNFENLKKLIITNKFLIFFIPLFIFYMQINFNRKKILSLIIFFNFIFLFSIFLSLRDQAFYQIYFIPLILLILVELSLLNKKFIFSIIVLVFITLNSQNISHRITQGFNKDINEINLCSFDEGGWNMMTKKIKYIKFRNKVCY